jgi:hypothetical protein
MGQICDRLGIFRRSPGAPSLGNRYPLESETDSGVFVRSVYQKVSLFLTLTVRHGIISFDRYQVIVCTV